MRRVSCLGIVLLATVPSSAHAFCGFYVGTDDNQLTSRASVVVMMRDGTRTVLSMSNHYEGPLEDFAMVVPVPTVLHEEDVHVLERSVVDRVVQLSSPRLVEYWEQDPCPVGYPQEYQTEVDPSVRGPVVVTSVGHLRSERTTVTVEAEFQAGEYDIVILSAFDSSGLERWLVREGYRIPAGAAAVLRPYVAAGTKFFVARVDPGRVNRDPRGVAMLSPLRMHYDSEQFNLPIRLGLISSAGEQDLLVHILARGTRFEVANYENVTIPTNLIVEESVVGSFASFYASLFDHVHRRYPGAVVTEYVWGSSSCDPCSGPPLQTGDLVTLGLDVLGGDQGNWTLTRLHHRYDRQLDADLVFRPAEAIAGGRGSPNRDGEVTRSVERPGFNNFQGRYIVLHRWSEAVQCESPVRGVWGGPPDQRPSPAEGTPNVAFVESAGAVDEYLAGKQSLDVARSDAQEVPVAYTGRRIQGGGCGCGHNSGSYVMQSALWWPVLFLIWRRRRLLR